ncbi:MAG: acyltransferase family protein [Lachnospiraceae bacterium]|nr:acyltransferase family protein [Lachnospiraceae bacterium]
MNYKSEKQEYITLLNVLSAFAVVFLHTNNCFWTFSTERYWITANIIESVMYFAVPVFFMITGATLIDYRERYSTKEYFKKRFWKTVFPFLVWSILSPILSTLRLGGSLSDLTLIGFINGTLNTTFSVYWFFVPLFCIYAAIPLFAAVPKERRKAIFSYLAIICFLVNSLIPFIFQLLPWGITLSNSWDISVGREYLLYVLAGYLLHNYEIKKPARYAIYALALAGLMLHMCGTYFASMEAGYIDQRYKGYCNVPATLYSVGIFLLVQQISPWLMKCKPLKRVVSFLHSYTFGIYLLHWHLVLFIANGLNLNVYSIIYRLGFPFVLIGLCVGIVYLLRKIPVIRRIVP